MRKALRIILLFLWAQIAGAASVELHWTAPGDDGMVGTATSYQMAYDTLHITESNWASCPKWPEMPAPLVAGSAQSVFVTGLVQGKTYFFRIKTVDEAGNWSDLSNEAAKIPQGCSEPDSLEWIR